MLTCRHSKGKLNDLGHDDRSVSLMSVPSKAVDKLMREPVDKEWKCGGIINPTAGGAEIPL